MATADFTNCSEAPPPAEIVQLPARPLDSALPLFRFGTRQMLCFFAGTSALLAAMASSDGPTALVLLLLTTMVAAHISATAIGTRLRARANIVHTFEAVEHLRNGSIATALERHAQVSAVHAQLRSPWHTRGSTALPWLRQFVIAAVVLGGLLGAVTLALAIGYRVSLAGIVIGGLSIAVLCGWFAFLCGSFYGVFRHGFREAASPGPPFTSTE